MIQASFAIVSITLIFLLILVAVVYFVFTLMLYKNATEYISVTATISLIILICGIGLFDANAIQFGMDQLLEASSTQLSAFVHWYFWFMHLGQQAVFGVLLLTLSVLSSMQKATSL